LVVDIREGHDDLSRRVRPSVTAFSVMDPLEYMSPGAMLDLAVLGVVSERARTTAEVVAIVKRLGGARFRPTADVIAGRIAALVEAGLLTSSPGDTPGDVRWQPAARGRVHLQRLLTTPSAVPVDVLSALCAGLKICFLEMLEPAARQTVLDDLLAAHRRVLSEAQGALSGCSYRCPLLRRCFAREVERWESELVWLEALAAEVAPRPWPC
jgi:DNA-binding PadR family transcriptional regulator